MDPRVAAVLARLEDRSIREQRELAELNDKGARFVREAASRFMLDVGVEVGKLLNLLARSLGARRVIEIGGSVGYSTLWFAEAVRSTGGRVVSFEIDPGKVALMRENLADAGLLEHVEIIDDDASKHLPSLEGPFDLVLIDHWKDLYIRDFDLAWPRVRRGGLVVADNILHPASTLEAMQAYVSHVRAAPGARSFTLSAGNGVEITARTDERGAR
ncbi:O-methyltransferase [Sorangium sp. So ce1097]|uniref:O-methyltransferase n=1 Tax=Sorangium sp. So ce1097 TaxID=3133330 RepID=UPI003F5E8BB0